MLNKDDKPRILIVDDEEEIRDTLSRHYKFQGYQTMTAGNGVEALKVLEKERIEIVISDIMMPVMNGVELLHKIRSDFPMTHVIIMTGYVTMDNLLAALRYGADTCIFKPITEFDEMDESVEMAIKHLKKWQKKLLELQGLKGE